MVHYSVDTNPRLRPYFIIALISAGIAFWLTSLFNMLHAKFITPSAFVVYALLVWLFDKYLWRVNFLSGIPDLSGKWKGTVTRRTYNQESEESFDVTFTITQNWQDIDIASDTAISSSSSSVVGLFLKNKDRIYLKYIYKVKAKNMTVDQTQFDEGASELRLETEKGVSKLSGPYYNDRGRFGDVNVTKQG